MGETTSYPLGSVVIAVPIRCKYALDGGERLENKVS